MSYGPADGIALALDEHGAMACISGRRPRAIFASRSCRTVIVETDSAHPASGRRALAMILVVDDDPDTLARLHLVLSMLGFDAITVRNAQEALECVEKRVPDLIITDSTMPSMSGLELSRVLRASERTRRIPIVLHAGVDLPAEVPRLYDRIIAKPADLDASVKLIRELLSPGISGAR